MSRTATPAPTDKSMWRKLLRVCHPDSGGDGDLFIWARELQEYVAGDDPEPKRESNIPPQRPREQDKDRVPFESELSFTDLTDRALDLAKSVSEMYGDLLRLLEDCREATHGPLVTEQRRSASYKRLAAIGHSVGMSKAERVEWYRIAESIPMPDRHAGHILSKLNKERRA